MTNVFIGILLISLSMGLVFTLVIRSRKIINTIASKKLVNLQDIKREFRRGK